MNAYLHLIIAVLSIYIAYWLGQHHGREAFVENIVRKLLSKLDNEGFIRTTTDKDGELELVPISEVVAKSLREAKNYV
jgi:hypothetical protein